MIYLEFPRHQQLAINLVAELQAILKWLYYFDHPIKMMAYGFLLSAGVILWRNVGVRIAPWLIVHFMLRFAFSYMLEVFMVQLVPDWNFLSVARAAQSVQYLILWNYIALDLLNLIATLMFYGWVSEYAISVQPALAKGYLGNTKRINKIPALWGTVLLGLTIVYPMPCFVYYSLHHH